MKILIIEDNAILRENLQTFFELQKIQVETHTDYHGASYKIINSHFDAVILDLGLSSTDGDGIKICQEVRQNGCGTPILMLTARAMTDQKILGLSVGADDYITKPFDYYELLARIEAVVRRDATHKTKNLSLDILGKNLQIDENGMKVFFEQKEVDLSKMEFRLLVFLAKNQGKILKKEIILETVWGEFDAFRESRSVDIYVGYLRKKLHPEIIETIRSVGYRIP